MNQNFEGSLHRSFAAAMRLSILGAALTGVMLMVPSVGFVQEAPPAAETASPTPKPIQTAIPAAEILGRAAEVGPILRSVALRTDFDDQLQALESDFHKELEHILKLEEKTLRRLEMPGPASVIEEAEKVWSRTSFRINGWLDSLSADSRIVEEELKKLKEEVSLWELTWSSAAEVELPPAVLEQVDETKSAVKATQEHLRETRDAILNLQTDVSRALKITDEILVLQRNEIVRRRRKIIGQDSPPLWQAFGVPGVDGTPSDQIEAMSKKGVESIRVYVFEKKPSIYRQLLFLVFLTGFLILLRHRAKQWVQKDDDLLPAMQMLDRPFAAALVFTILPNALLHPQAPTEWINFLGMVLVFAVLRVLPQIVHPSMKPGAYILAFLYFLKLLVDIAPNGNLMNRLALLVLSMAAGCGAFWFIRTIEARDQGKSGFWYQAVFWFSKYSVIAFSVGFLSNLIGSVGFATILVFSTLFTAFVAVICWVAALLLRTIVRIGLLTDVALRLAIVRQHGEVVKKTLFRWITTLAVVGWLWMSLVEIGGFGATINRLKKFIDSEISFGNFNLVLADVLIFVLIIWLTFTISRLLRFVLDADVMPRLDLPRGVPGAITRLSHYGIIIVGVTVAAVASGIDFSRITLIIGGLGVGIGFGLQTVVNNFVSGLILLFERPIRVGDKIQVRGNLGFVSDIGLRASIISTFQGAEVIVPNADLISSDVVNWTLSNDYRRMEFSIGVAYGSSPEKVIELLVGVANAHMEVLVNPEPVAVFTDFGDSALMFQLRAWTRGDIVAVSSGLRVGVNRALADAGIEIPFPQRDIHIRSEKLNC